MDDSTSRSISAVAILTTQRYCIPLQLTKSYLQNRIQLVQINSTMSTTTSINIGIPQGSVLDPLFFNIMYKRHKNCTNKFDIVLLRR